MLYQSLTRPYELGGLSFAQKDAVLKEQHAVVLAIQAGKCLPPAGTPASNPAPDDCAREDREYTVHLRQPPGAESSDLAKQLLVLIGTLMTSVTSFYFASRSNEAATKTMLSALETATTPSKDKALVPAAGAMVQEDCEDGCDAPIENPTDDVDLPPAKGAVEAKQEGQS